VGLGSAAGEAKTTVANKPHGTRFLAHHSTITLPQGSVSSEEKSVLTKS
jgi:hypothetical protein